MKVVQINCSYPDGSTGKITKDIHSYLEKEGVESYVLYGVGAPSNDKHIIKVCSEGIRKMQSLRARITGYAYGGCVISTNRILRELDSIQPDIVHLHCINAYIVNIYRLMDYLKKKDIPTVITMHAEFLYTGRCGYAIDCKQWITGCRSCAGNGSSKPPSFFFERSPQEWNLLKAAYKGFDRLAIVTVSDWLKGRALQSPMMEGKSVQTILNGLDTQVFKRNNDAITDSNTHTKIILHVTPNFDSPIKGGTHVIEMARRFTNDDVKFVVVGAKDTSLAVPSNVELICHTKNQQELAQYYAAADICLLTSLRETFSMVCAESLCCGTPVVGFEAGAPETISIPEYSEFVQQGDDDALECALRRWLSKDINKQSIAQQAQHTYDRNMMAHHYFSVYEGLISRYK